MATANDKQVFYPSANADTAIAQILKSNSTPGKTAEALMNVGSKYGSAKAYNIASVNFGDKCNNYTMATECAKKALEIDPDNHSAMSNVKVYGFRAVEKEHATQYAGFCINNARKLAKIEPSKTAILFDLGCMYTSKIKNGFEAYKDDEIALKYFNMYIKRDPKGQYVGDAYNNIAVIYGDIYKDYTKAVEYSRRALELEPNAENIKKNYSIYKSCIENRSRKSHRLPLRFLDVAALVLIVVAVLIIAACIFSKTSSDTPVAVMIASFLIINSCLYFATQFMYSYGKAAHVDTSKMGWYIFGGWLVAVVVTFIIFAKWSSAIDEKERREFYDSYKANSSSNKYGSSSGSGSSAGSSGKTGSSSSYSSSSGSHGSYINAEPLDYDTPEDYADDAWDDFGDWDAAYDYWDDY